MSVSGAWSILDISYLFVEFSLLGSVGSCLMMGLQTDGLFLIEVDRLLKPGGYFVLTSPTSKPHGSSSSTKKISMDTPVERFAGKICWILLAQQDETIIWQKTADASCYKSQ